MHLSQLEKFLKNFELLYYINTFAMEKSFMLQNIVSNITRLSCLFQKIINYR